MPNADAYLHDAFAAFELGAPVAGTKRFGQGHINDTYLVETQASRRFIFQRISPVAFKRPDQLMENVVGITEYLSRELEKTGGDARRGTLRFLRTREGGYYYTDPDGGAWRAYPFVEGTVCYETAETPELFAASGRAFGRFQRLLQGYPAQTLYETIPRFHDTEDRLAKLKAAAEADPLGRKAGCQAEISFILAREADCSVALQALREGRLPLRVTHNDTKLNNVLMDEKTGEGVCIVDLDTVMPGLSINDFGDSIRFGANHSAEDETDLSKVNLDVDLFAAYTAAFLEDALSRLGLTRREANEFIVYWLPRMEPNPYNLISFQSAAYTDHARLTVTPEPDSLLRVFMAWKPLEAPADLPAQELPPFKRTGFTVVEWGGAELSAENRK